MKFDKASLKAILDGLSELPADGMDEMACALLEEVRRSVNGLRRLRRKPSVDDLEAALKRNALFLDVCRLVLGKGQEPVAHMLCAQLGGKERPWSNLRALASEEPHVVAQALAAIGLPDAIQEQIKRKWELEDVLIERYMMSRGRAVAGQKRGRALEDDVETVLRDVGVPFESRVTFIGQKGIGAKCDFAVPDRNAPKIVIEAKGFEATGSKLTDFLGDVLKMGQAKQYHMYVLVVTDGRGWHNRQSDLKRLVQYQNDGLIDMIYTRSGLAQLAADVNHIYRNE
jgi:hypothetical protein